MKSVGYINFDSVYFNNLDNRICQNKDQYCQKLSIQELMSINTPRWSSQCVCINDLYKNNRQTSRRRSYQLTNKQPSRRSICVKSCKYWTFRDRYFEFKKLQVGNGKGQNLYFVFISEDGQIIGDWIGANYWDWLFVDLMWIMEDLCGHDKDHRFWTIAEEEARKFGAKNASRHQ